MNPQQPQPPTNRKRRKRPTPSIPPESILFLPTPPSVLPIVDTHTHIISTFEMYKKQYREGQHKDAYEFVKALYAGKNVEAVVDVWCDGPVRKLWKTYANAGKEQWGGMEYWFVLGVHPHDAKSYTDAVDKDVLEAMAHPRCVGLGEIGLDYHYDNSPRDVQQAVFTRQLRHSVRLGKPLTIHTREADDDCERIMKAEVPKDHRIHVHCFSDTPEFAKRLLDHFPNLYIGITGIITYATNTNTANVIRDMMTSSSIVHAPSADPSPSSSEVTTPRSKLRILLETDAPYMVPSNLYADLPSTSGPKQKLPVCHTAMIPWTAKFVADVANKALKSSTAGEAPSFLWDADMVMEVGRENAKKMYGV